uniref:Uncharacterized protein n=1 Tax=Chenopodium quinoa TaxID=63459 RepID=A0A803N8P0_CHEQI
MEKNPPQLVILDNPTLEDFPTASLSKSCQTKNISILYSQSKSIQLDNTNIVNSQAPANFTNNPLTQENQDEEYYRWYDPRPDSPIPHNELVSESDEKQTSDPLYEPCDDGYGVAESDEEVKKELDTLDV